MSNLLRDLLRLELPGPVEVEQTDRSEADGYSRTRLRYQGLEGDEIPALLFLPEGGPRGAVVAFHQHNGEFHLGKSEIAGDAGDPFQAFAPALARRGLAVLAPDAITFEERRTSGTGITPHEDDWLQHYNALGYRLVNGDILMRKCLDDAQRAVSVLEQFVANETDAVGVFGHSYGGTTALYLGAVDPRCRFVCVSGALCSFARRQAEGTGINMFELVPGIARKLEAGDLLRAISPRPTFVLSASRDPYSSDAHEVVSRAGVERCRHMRVDGEHRLDAERFEAMVEWLTQQPEQITS